MQLTPREFDKLLVYMLAEVALKRKAKGIKLNYPEAVAIISAKAKFMLKAIRDGQPPKRMEADLQTIERHAERIDRNWRARVGPDDWVLVPGDISWAMKLEEALNGMEPIDREILALRFQADLSYEEAAVVCGVTPEAARKRAVTAFLSAMS